VTVTEEEQIFAGTVHRKLFRLMLHHREIERDKEVGAAQGTSRVSGIHAMYLSDDIAANL
jgi:hypothetical protein